MYDDKEGVLSRNLELDSPSRTKTVTKENDDSFKSPVKHSNLPLPPVDENMPPQLNISKREIQLVSDHGTKTDHKIPLKTRKNNLKKRISSPTSLHKLDLKPPKSEAACTTIYLPERSLKSERIPFSSSLSKTEPTVSELKRQDTGLDLQLKRARTKLESLKRAKQILQRKDTYKNSQLIEKWRTIAQKASNYLLNAAIDKVNKAGGKQEFVRKEREKLKETLEYSIDNSFQDRIYDISNSEQFQELAEIEQERILDELEREQEKALEEAEKSFLDGDDDVDEIEFTMRDLYKRLKLNYKLVYPNNNE